MLKKKESELTHLNRSFDSFRNTHLRCFGISDNRANLILSGLSLFAEKYNKNGPDLYSTYDDVIIGIEHFEYDASAKNRNGSKERREIERIHNTFQEEARLAFNSGKKDFLKSYKLNANGDVDTLKQSFLKGFKKHQTKINSYKKNIQDVRGVNNPDIWFLAEDTGIMGPMFHSGYFVDNQPEYPLLPAFYEDIQKEILSSNIAGIIFVSTFPISRYVAFIKNSKNSFRELIKHYYFKENVPIQFFNDSSYTCSSFLVTEIKEQG